eukprot:TRINITY_DN88253_c0_g1_i1.p1 TRINITY_DN88253_c0_g1~~TRINITY_DN88253_c0_g1_i1.p1  ORF type:complete len:446 (-),score=35.93 TRINITY_DN88253_c0_g1_i1:355-1692(-)
MIGRPRKRLCTHVNIFVGCILCLSFLVSLTSISYFSGRVPTEQSRSHPLTAAADQTVLRQQVTHQSAFPDKTLHQKALNRTESRGHVDKLPAGTVKHQQPRSQQLLRTLASAPSPPPLSQQESTVLCGGHRARTCADCIAGHDGGWCHGECAMFGGTCQPKSVRDSATIPQIITELIKEYPFQPVRSVPYSEPLNIVFVRSPPGESHKQDIERYKDKILFLGICSMEDFPLPSPNPFSENFSVDAYTGLLPGWLHMFRHPETIFPSHVKLLLQSQSDFSAPSVDLAPQEKKYDFVFSGTDQNVASDCVGWASFAKNWTFVKQALEVMCGEYGMTGVLVASKDKQGRRACTIPKICEGKVLQTSFLPQWQFFDYVRQSKFALLPQVHDASPRAATHALALDTPVLMNWHIMGGWKYINEQTGEFFHDMTDFRQSLQKLINNLGNYR